MTTGQLLALDLLVVAATAAAWLGAGAATAAGRVRVAAPLAAAAVTATLLQVVTIAALATAGWWFVQERVTFTLPLLVAAGLAAAVLAGPWLSRAALRTANRVPGRPAPDSAGPPPGVVVALLTAGYAATAGLVVTFLVGYPVGWGVALITGALVGVAALVTWRVLSPVRPPLLTRITAVVAGLGLAVSVACEPDRVRCAPAPAEDLGGGPPPAPAQDVVAVSELRGPAEPAPGGQIRRHTLVAQRAMVTLASGRPVAAWTFNATVPGPAITAVEGDLVEVTLRNADIGDGVTLHWHGYDVPSGEDGVPGLTQDAVAPGEEHVYRFRADQVGSYWYHTHQVSDRGVRLGLYGTLVVTPRQPADPSGVDLTVPVHTFDGVRVVGADDQPGQHRVEPGAPVRLRLVNTDDTPHRFALAGTSYRLVAVDGRDLHRPGEVQEVALRLPAGGRYDLAFTMPSDPVALLIGDDRGGAGLRLLPGDHPEPAEMPGDHPDLGEVPGDHPDLGEVPGDHPDLGEPPEPTGWPELDLLSYGAPAATPFDAGSRFDRDFPLVLDRGLAMVNGLPRYAHTVNGRGHPSIPTQLVAENDLVRFTVVNRSLETHPWHLHGHTVLVLSRDGERPAGSPLWLDTFDVRPGEVWEVGFRATNPGLWMNHCHNLPHAHQGMMLHLGYQGIEPHRHR